MSSDTLASRIPGLQELWTETTGDARICVAVLDGPVDLAHSCFAGAAIEEVETLVPCVAGDDLASRHGTHVASVIQAHPVVRNSPTAGHGVAALLAARITPSDLDICVTGHGRQRTGVHQHPARTEMHPGHPLDLQRRVGTGVCPRLYDLRHSHGRLPDLDRRLESDRAALLGSCTVRGRPTSRRPGAERWAALHPRRSDK